MCQQQVQHLLVDCLPAWHKGSQLRASTYPKFQAQGFAWSLWQAAFIHSGHSWHKTLHVAFNKRSLFLWPSDAKHWVVWLLDFLTSGVAWVRTMEHNPLLMQRTFSSTFCLQIRFISPPATSWLVFGSLKSFCTRFATPRSRAQEVWENLLPTFLECLCRTFWV